MGEITEQEVKSYANLGWHAIQEAVVSEPNPIPDENLDVNDSRSQLPNCGMRQFENSFNDNEFHNNKDA